jgi:hypothetical protein
LLAAARTVSLPAAAGILQGELLVTHDRSGRLVDIEAVATKQRSPALIASVRSGTLALPGSGMSELYRQNVTDFGRALKKQAALPTAGESCRLAVSAHSGILVLKYEAE